jgi:hypothetical protein
MRDFDKLQEDKGSSNYKPIIIFICICILIIGAIIYVITELTTQYNFLNEQYAKVQKKVMKVNENAPSMEKYNKTAEVDVPNSKGEVRKENIENNHSKLEKVDSSNLGLLINKGDNITQDAVAVDEKDTVKEYFMLQLMEGKNINEINEIANFYSKYFNNVHVKPINDKTSYIVRCCRTDKFEKIKINEMEIKRRFNINPHIIKVSEWVNNNKPINSDKYEYIIQLSSNTSEKEASDIMHFYKKYFFDTYIATDEDNGIKWYKVRCCFSSSLKDAERRVAEIKERFNISSTIIAIQDELYKEKIPQIKYVLELNRKESLEEAKEIMEFYGHYFKDTYITQCADKNGLTYAIRCCTAATEEDALKVKNDLKDRFNIMSTIVKIDLLNEKKIDSVEKSSEKKDMIKVNEKNIDKTKVHYLIQLASNKNKKETMDIVKLYKKHIDDVYYISQRVDNDTTWYKIRCCATDDLEEANSKLVELKKQFNIEPIIVKSTE